MNAITFSKKIWIVILIILVFVIGLVIFWRGYRHTINKSTQVFKSAGGLQIEADQLSGLNIKVPGGDKNSYWSLNFAKFTDLGAVGGLDTINGEYYRDSKLVYRLTAKSGTVHWQSQELQFYNPVAVSVDQTKELSAKEMLWKPKTRIITAAGQVKVRVNDLIIRTGKLAADFDLDRIVLKGLTTTASE